MASFPRRVYRHFSLRQLDLSFGGFGSQFLLILLAKLDRLHVLPPIPSATAHRLPSKLLAGAIQLMMLGRPAADIPTEAQAADRMRLMPAVHDYPTQHDYRPFAVRSNISGYYITRRCAAALPAIASAAFAWECCLPALSPWFLTGALLPPSTFHLPPSTFHLPTSYFLLPT